MQLPFLQAGAAGRADRAAAHGLSAARDDPGARRQRWRPPSQVDACCSSRARICRIISTPRRRWRSTAASQARVAAFDPEGLLDLFEEYPEHERGRFVACGGGPAIAVMMAARALGVEQQDQRGEAGDHRALRNAASTAVRATQVASTVSASGKQREEQQVDARQRRAARQLAGEGRARRRAAAGPAPPRPRPARLPISASIAILRWNRCVTWTSVAPMPCITSIVKRWVSSAPRAASTTAAAAARAQQQDQAERDPLQQRGASGAAGRRFAVRDDPARPGAIACTRRSIAREVGARRERRN